MCALTMRVRLVRPATFPPYPSGRDSGRQGPGLACIPKCRDPSCVARLETNSVLVSTGLGLPHKPPGLRAVTDCIGELLLAVRYRDKARGAQHLRRDQPGFVDMHDELSSRSICYNYTRISSPYDIFIKLGSGRMRGDERSSILDARLAGGDRDDLPIPRHILGHIGVGDRVTAGVVELVLDYLAQVRL